MNRTNIVLSAILVVQLVLVGLALRPAETTAPKTKTFFEGIGKDAVTALVIHDQDKELRLEKKDDAWLVQADHEYPADATKITALLDKLTGLSSNRLVARTRASHVRLKVADDLYNRRLDLVAGDTTISLYLGSSPTYKTLHVRLADEDEVYLVTDLSIWELQTTKESWWKTRYLDLAATDLTRVELENKAGSFTIEKKKDAEAPWRLAGEDAALDPKAVDDFLAAASRITLLTYLGTEEKPDYGLDKPAATTRLTTKDGKTITVRIGPKNKDENNHVVKRDDSPFYVSVAAYAVEKLLDKTADSLLAAKEAPSPDDTTGPDDNEAPPEDKAAATPTADAADR